MTNIILLNLGYFLVFLALAIREILWLRITITAGQSTLFTYSMLNGNYNIAFWNSIFVLVNIFQIIILYRERQEVEIPNEIRDLYDSIFHTILNGNFYFSGTRVRFVRQKRKHLLPPVIPRRISCLSSMERQMLSGMVKKLPHWIEASSLRKSVMLQESQLLRMLFLKVV